MSEFASTETLSGLAGEIRTSFSSEQFDLNGYNEIRAKDLIITSFTNPLTAPNEMVKFTFVVGGGKLVRSRYSEDLPKWLVGALRDIGYTEDRSAAETFDSQGTFKQQHDTGQNLKYLIVYPRIACANTVKGGKDGGDINSTPIIDQSSPEYLVTACEIATFKEIVSSKVISYKQKKGLLRILQSSSDEFKKIEEKLISGALLTSYEQQIYDSNSGNDAEKISWLQSEVKAMVDNGQLTEAEKSDLVRTLTVNLTNLSVEIEAAVAENKPKKVENLNQKKSQMIDRLKKIEQLSPIQHRLRFGDEIQKLRMKLFPLLALEEGGRSMSLTLADLKTLEGKAEIEEEIKAYEQSSRGWFEEESDFIALCAYEEKQAKTKYTTKLKAHQGTKKSSSSGSSGSKAPVKGTYVPIVGATNVAGWSTAPKKSVQSSRPVTGVTKKPASSFAAAFDSDSD
eukprot:gene6451-8873_t